MIKITDATFVFVLVVSIALASTLIWFRDEPNLTEKDIEITEVSQIISNSTTTTEVDINKLGDNFLAYYKANRINNYVVLTSEEANKTLSLNKREPKYFVFNNYECFRKDRGTVHEALLDEYLELNEANDYYADSMHIVIDESNKRYGYFLTVSYNCKLLDDNSEYPEWTYLYGLPFYQNGTWWAYIEKDWEPVPMDVPIWYTYLATRTKLEGFESTYTEWVIDALPPEIEMLDCPAEEITEDSYEIKFNIKTGNAGLAYFGTFIQKDGENYTRAFFEKGFNDDVFPFPEANTTTSYGQLIERYVETENPEFKIELIVKNDYDLYADASCTIKFSK